MLNGQRVVAVIPARGGSKTVPGKNIRPLAGKPLIAWSIEVGRQVPEIDRIGLEQDYYEILQIQIPHVTIPVRQGRNLANLVEVAALDQKLKAMGQNSAVEFNERLLKAIGNRGN